MLRPEEFVEEVDEHRLVLLLGEDELEVSVDEQVDMLPALDFFVVTGFFGKDENNYRFSLRKRELRTM